MNHSKARPPKSLGNTLLYTAIVTALLISTQTLWHGEVAHAVEHWPQWRGPNANGHSPDKRVPLRWHDSPTESKNIHWKRPLTGLGTSTPIVWEHQVFVTSQLGRGPIEQSGAEFPDAVKARKYDSSNERTRFYLFAYHAEDGRELWKHTVTTLNRSDALPPVHRKHNLASPSPVTDGQAVYVWFGNGHLISVSLEGRLLWAKDLSNGDFPFTVLWGHASSPTLYRDLLILQIDHPSGARLLALNKDTGEPTWSVDRGEGLRSYSTPYIATLEGQDALVVNSSHRLEAYRPSTGDLLWFTGHEVTLAIPMPVLGNGVLYASRGYTSGPYFAVRLGGTGDVNDTHVLWRQPTRAPYISSMVFLNDRLYMATERGVAFVVDAKSGETIWRERLGGSFAASPVVANDHVFLMNEDGDTFVLADGAPPERVANNSIGRRTLASPAIANGRILIRTDSHLLSIGNDTR